MIIVLTISIITGFGSLMTKRYKMIFNCLSLFALVLVMSCNNTSPDEINIKYYYDAGIISSISLLFWIFAKFFSSLGFSFGIFNFVMTLLALILIISTLSIYTKSWGAVLSLYAISAACLDATLFRYFVGYSFIIYGFRFLLVERKIIKYLFWVVLAALFHYSFLIYSVFALMYYDFKKLYRYKKSMGIIISASVLLIAIGTFLNGRMVPGVSFFAGIIDPDNHSIQHLQRAGGHWGWLISVAFCVTNLLTLFVLKRKVRDRIGADGKYLMLIEGTIRINEISCLFIPLCIMYFHIFSRLYRPLFWLTALCIILEIESEKIFRLTVGKSKILLMGSLYFFTYIYCFNYIIYSHEYTIEKVLNGTFFFIN